VITWLTASPSRSMVTITSAPSTAAAGLSTNSAPASASGTALSLLRFHTRSGNPAASRLRPIPAPMIPVPSSATIGLSVIRPTLELARPVRPVDRATQPAART
jgi:hypothetical protein